MMLVVNIVQIVLTVVASTGLFLGLGGADPSSNQPVTQPEQEASTTQPAVAQPENASDTQAITDAESLLDALEAEGSTIHALSATLRYVKTFAIQGDTQIRDGTILFVNDADTGLNQQNAQKRFGITFNRLIMGDRVEDATTGFQERYIFDGQWLAEVYPKEHQFIRRQVVKPGEHWDPLRLGEGPFPVPIGQKKADILARFDASLLPGGDGIDARSLKRIANACYQLQLTPRADAGESDIREIRIWYDKKTLLPRIARTITSADDRAFVLLSKMQVNDAVSLDAVDLSTQPPADTTGWSITSEPWQE